jgi:ubiquinol-cytochrome c reductase subunit 6
MASAIVEKLAPNLKAETAVEGPGAEEEEDLVDPATHIKETCAEAHCSAVRAKLDDCNARVTSKTKTTETCYEEILDFYHCVDHCAAPQIFQQLK